MVFGSFPDDYIIGGGGGGGGMAVKNATCNAQSK